MKGSERIWMSYLLKEEAMKNKYKLLKDSLMKYIKYGI